MLVARIKYLAPKLKTEYAIFHLTRVTNFISSKNYRFSWQCYFFAFLFRGKWTLRPVR